MEDGLKIQKLRQVLSNKEEFIKRVKKQLKQYKFENSNEEMR